MNNQNNINEEKTNDGLNEDTMLNRERQNIVKASIEANQNIDQNMADVVNNAIKVEEKNQKKNILTIIVVIILVIAVTAFTVLGLGKFLKGGIEESEKTTEIITSSPMETYLNKKESVRKFEGSTEFILNGKKYNKMVLLLAPENVTNKYMMLCSDGTLVYKEYGDYSITNKKISLKGNNETLNEFTIKDDMLSSYIDLHISDTEMKSYKYKDDTTKKLLMINATLNMEYALYVDNDLTFLDKYLENEISIVMNNKTFNKIDDNLSIDNYTLEYVK